MSRAQRVGLIAIAAIIAIGAVIVLGGDDDEQQATTRPTTATSTTTTTSTVEQPGSQPTITTIRIADGKPVAGIADIKVDKGERIRFTVTSDAAHEIHFHGYDISKDVAAGASVTFDQKATIDGIFQVEIEDLGEQIAKVTVNP